MWSLLRGARSLVSRPVLLSATSALAVRGNGASLAAPLLVRTMKVMSSLKKRCSECKMVRRGKILYVYCKAHPRHKARQGPKRRKK